MGQIYYQILLALQFDNLCSDQPGPESFASKALRSQQKHTFTQHGNILYTWQLKQSYFALLPTSVGTRRLEHNAYE